MDEDSWQILAVDCYDSRGQLYRVQEGHVINYYDVPALWTDLELVLDLSNGRYLALGLQNEEPRSYDFSIKRTAADYPAQRAAAARDPLELRRVKEHAPRAPLRHDAPPAAAVRWPPLRWPARPAPRQAPRAGRDRAPRRPSLLIALATAGKRLVAVGDRGVIVLFRRPR